MFEEWKGEKGKEEKRKEEKKKREQEKVSLLYASEFFFDFLILNFWLSQLKRMVIIVVLLHVACRVV